jgi:hypothetical protein
MGAKLQIEVPTLVVGMLTLGSALPSFVATTKLKICPIFIKN